MRDKIERLFTRIKLKFSKKKSVYGPSIFYQRTWLAKQVDEALWKRAFRLDE